MNLVKSIFFKTTLFLMILTTSVNAQINTPAGAIIPFGSNLSYPNGMMPTNLPTGGAYGKSTDAANAYNSWKTNYIVSCAGGQFRVKFDDPNQTVSEGIAYGMLLSAYAADKALFDGLWAYYKANVNGNGVMNWRINGCTNASGSNGATDAELDAALALLVADAQWPLATSPYDYTTEATTLINKIKSTEMDPANFQATNGDAWGTGTDCRNPSYQAPAYYRLFGAAIPADVTYWGTNAVNGAYTLIQANAHATTGLVSDWSNKAGATSACQSGSTSGLYGYDACRNPWRMGTDYIWNAESRARTQCDKIASYVNGQGAANCGGPRQQNGSGSGGHFATFVSTYATAIMGATPATYQTLLNSMYTQTVGVSDFYQNSQPSGYFGNTLRCVSLFMMSGNFWKPGTSLVQEINVQRSGTNIASGSTVDLGNVQQGTNGDFTFTIQNLGATALTITNPITITGTGAAKYTIQTAPGTSVAANGTTTFVLRFTPGASVTGQFTATLSITNNDGTGGENPYVINVLATGTTNPTAPEIDVQYNSTSYASASTFNMGNLSASATTASTAYKTFTIVNTGTASLTTAVSITGAGYSIYGTPPTSIAAGTSATFTVALNSGNTAPATRAGTVTITNNDGNEATYTINLTSSIVTCATALTASQVLQDYEANNNVTLNYNPPIGASFSATATNPSIGGLNTSPIVASITRDATMNVTVRYQPGCASGGNFDMSNPVVSILFYSPAAGIPIYLSPKTSGGAPIIANYDSDSKNVTTKVNQWERLYFNMSNIINNTSVRFFDIMIDPTGVNGTPSKVYRFDDIRYDVAPCITSLPSTKVFMDYDGIRNLSFVYPLGAGTNTLTEVFANPSATGINTSANVARFVRSNTLTYQGWRYSGCQNKIDLSANPIVSMLVRTATANVPITMSFTDGTGAYIGGATVNSGPANTWNKLYFDLTAIQTSTAIAFMDIYPDAAGAFLSNTTYYFDDIKYDALPCAAPATANAGTDITICSGGSATLAGTITNATGSTWSGGMGTFAPNTTTLTASYTPTAAEVTAGVATLTLTTTGMGSGCTAASDQVVITITGGLTTSAAGSDQTVCAATATLAGNTPTTGTGAWSVVTGTATVTTPSSPTSGVTGLVVGSATLRWTISGSGCTSSTDDVVITRNDVPTVSAAGSDQSVCAATATLAGNTPTVGTGAWTVVSGTATVTTPTSPTSGVTALVTGSATLRWTISNSPCTASTDDVIITRVAALTTSAAGSDQTICGATATLAGNTATVGTGAWTVISGTATVTTPTSPTSGVTAIAVGSATLRWTISGSGCTPSTDDVVITRNDVPTTSAAGSDQTVCAATATLAGNTATIGTGAWTVVSGTATVTTPTSPTSGVTALVTGSATLRWTISNSPCTASSDDVVITRNAAPTTSAAGGDQTICATTATLAANTATVGTGAWSVVSGTATVTTPSSPTSGVTAIGVGTATLRWTISNSPCTVSTDDVVITRNDVPTTSAAGSDQTICATTATLAGNTATVGTGAWTVVSGTATITTPSSPTSGITAIGVGSATLRWTISNSPCTASSDDVIITRNAAPTTAAAGSDQTICAATATLAGNTATVGTGAWTVVSGTATVTTPSSPTSGVTAIGVGAATLRWTISNSPCTASTDDVIITRNDVPTVSAAGTDQTICGSTTTLAGNTATVGTGAWTVVSGTATITTPSSPTSGVTGLAIGANTLRWTISNSPCTASTDDVIINVTGGITTAAAGGDQTVCASTATLAGNTPTTGTGAWSVVSGTAVVTTPSSPTSGVTGLVTGSATLRWTISLGGCTPSTDDVVITRNAPPTTSAAGSDQTVCGTTATLAGNTATIGTGAWSVISGSATVTTPSSSTSGITGLGVGANTLRWTISNAPCTASSDDVIITGVAAPTTSAAGSDQTVCAATSTLAGNTATVGTGTWTVISGTAVITTASSPTSGVTGLVTGSATLRWTISNSPCAASTDDVVITRNAPPTTSAAGSDQSICAATATLAGNAPTIGTGNWTVVSGTATITTPSSPTSGVTGLAIGTNTLRWTISNSPCTASTDDVVINVTGGLTTADAGGDQTVCASTATLAGNTPTTGTGAWSVISGTANVTTPSSPTSGVTGLVTGSATLRWTISLGGCTPSTDDVIITRNANPTTSAAGSDQTICGSTATLAGNTAATGTGAWSVISGTANVTTPSNPTSGVTGLVTGSATLRWTISNSPCTASTDDVVITVNAAPTAANAGSDQNLCASTTATLAGNTATVGTGAWTVISGTANVTSSTSPTSGVTGLVTGSATLRWTISNSPCTPSTDDVVITVVNNPTTATAGSDQSICATSTTLAGNTAATGTGSWSVVSGTANFTTPSSATSAVTGLGIGSNTLRWTISNTPCTASTDDVIINVTGGITTADAGIDQNVLLPSTSATLGGNTPSSGTGAWSVVSGTATITTTSNPTSGVTGLGTGYNVLRWTISNGGCTPSTDDVSIFVGSTPGATTITGPTTVSANQTNVTYTFSPVNAGSVYTWTLPPGSSIVTSGPGTVTINVGTNPGNVSLTETNPLGTHTSDLAITIGATGVLYGLGTDTYEAYPSPFEDISNLKINSAETTPLKVKVMDSRGAVIYLSNEFFTNQNITIGKEFAVGIYYVEVSYQNKMQIIKLIKM